MKAVGGDVEPGRGVGVVQAAPGVGAQLRKAGGRDVVHHSRFPHPETGALAIGQGEYQHHFAAPAAGGQGGIEGAHVQAQRPRLTQLGGYRRSAGGLPRRAILPEQVDAPPLLGPGRAG